jgi:hypothetical protein
MSVAVQDILSTEFPVWLVTIGALVYTILSFIKETREAYDAWEGNRIWRFLLTVAVLVLDTYLTVELW